MAAWGEAKMEWAIRARNGSCRRRNLRIELTPPMEIVLRSDAGEFRGELHDISLGGARVRATCLPAVTGPLVLAYDDQQEIHADVKWCADELVGVAFQASPPAVDLLTQCLRRLVPLDCARD